MFPKKETFFFVKSFKWMGFNTVLNFWKELSLFLTN